MKTESTRRGFLAGAAAALAPAIVPASALGRGAVPPSDRVALAVIGCGGRGMAECRFYVPSDACRIVAVCDVREDRRLRAKQTFEKLYAQAKAPGGPHGIEMHRDFREVLRRSDIDAVHIATPDHWHVPITLAALRAGKDTHTEKPLGLTIEQDLAVEKAVRRHKRIFQYGTERRSTAEARQAVELVLNGRIGKVEKIYVVSPGSESGGAAAPVLPVPEGFDYDLWLGPAPQAPFCNDRCLVQGQRNGIFHIRDYSIGFIAGWAAHPLDIVQWWADHSGRGIPATYEGAGVLPKEGLFNSATAWDLRCTYADGLEMRFLDTESYRKLEGVPHPDMGRKDVRYVHNAAVFVGSKGWVAVAYEKAVTEPASLMGSTIGPNEKRLLRSDSHQLGFIEAVRTRKDPVSPVESAVRSDLVSHLSDISIRTGRKIRWDAKRQTIVGDEAARKLMSRPMRAPWSL